MFLKTLEFLHHNKIFTFGDAAEMDRVTDNDLHARFTSKHGLLNRMAREVTHTYTVSTLLG